ncbi:hypothetical protein [Ammoniphilus resinae]|uniref:DUF2158 domain-containing protein n=1 Tax=Ammoniphilus resinae TaxID=861532 RepID=A0ABS4GLT3_9BACL|nr:hypothetical protein [Ammoniphilus resinae]MBP1931226.1 hypothetical protein [Ammoniphilus resinae]
MKRVFQTGQRVEHKTLGEGTVTEHSPASSQVEVGFSELETYWVHEDELKLES